MAGATAVAASPAPAIPAATQGTEPSSYAAAYEMRHYHCSRLCLLHGPEKETYGLVSD